MEIFGNPHLYSFNIYKPKHVRFSNKRPEPAPTFNRSRCIFSDDEWGIAPKKDTDFVTRPYMWAANAYVAVFRSGKATIFSTTEDGWHGLTIALEETLPLMFKGLFWNYFRNQTSSRSHSWFINTSPHLQVIFIIYNSRSGHAIISS